MGLFGGINLDDIRVSGKTIYFKFKIKSKDENLKANISAGKIDRNKKFKEQWEFNHEENALIYTLGKTISNEDEELSLKTIKKMFENMMK